MCLLPDLAPNATCSSELDGDVDEKDVNDGNGNNNGNDNNNDYCYYYCCDNDYDIGYDEDYVDENGGLDAAKHDVLYRANYISEGFELANNLISEMSQLEPLNGAKARCFLERFKEIRIRNENIIRELIDTSNECRAVLEQLNIGVNNYVNDLINDNIMLNNTENEMDMTLGEIYDINS